MRCTEGVWLSVTPTQDALVVSMDFEGETPFPTFFNCLAHICIGVNSIERGAQEGQYRFA